MEESKLLKFEALYYLRQGQNNEDESRILG